jgi:hypothetical protein
MHRFPNRGGMMAEIIDDGDAAADAADFHAAFHAFKRVKGGLDLGIAKAAMTRAGDDCERIANVQFANERRLESGVADAKLGFCAGEMEIGGAKVRSSTEAKTHAPSVVPDLPAQKSVSRKTRQRVRARAV